MELIIGVNFAFKKLVLNEEGITRLSYIKINSIFMEVTTLKKEHMIPCGSWT